MTEILPRPGGLIDSARRDRAAAQLPAAQADTVTSADGPVPYDAVRVRPEPPDIVTARTVTLSAANTVLPLIPQDGQRRSCVILAVDNDVWVSHDQGAAWQVAGGATAEGAFYLAKGIALPVDSQGQLWAACTTTAAASRVSVLIAKDSAP